MFFSTPRPEATISYKMWGAGGGPPAPGTSFRDTGASGGYTAGSIVGVYPGDTLHIYVGQGGVSNGGATFGGGGAAGFGDFPAKGSSGGGASYIFINQPGTTPAANLIAVSGGGGGGSAGDYPSPNSAGSGGFPSGFNCPGNSGGFGGTQSAGGAGGTSPGTGTPGGSGGYLFGGGGGGSPPGGYGGGFAGGGGGGGYYGGGGGGGSGDFFYVASGGGGGSSYHNPSWVPVPSFTHTNAPGTGAGANTSDPDYGGSASQYAQPGRVVLTVNGTKYTYSYTGAVQTLTIA